jgi:hypothetical protein
MRNETGLRTNVSRPVRQFLTAKRKKAPPEKLRRPGSPHSKKHIPLPSNRQRNWIAASAKRNPLRHRDAISGKTHARAPSPPSCYRHAFRRSTFQSPFGARGKARTNSRSPSKTAEATQAAIGSANRRLPFRQHPGPFPARLPVICDGTVRNHLERQLRVGSSRPTDSGSEDACYVLRSGSTSLHPVPPGSTFSQRSGVQRSSGLFPGEASQSRRN